MATVVKNFRIKSGLIVEGTTATIGGQNILTETGGDAYILNLVGGATLVKSVGSNLAVDNEGQLSLDLVGIASDLTGTRLYTDGSTLNVDVEGVADDLIDTFGFATTEYADQAETDAVSSANSYTDGRETAITTAYEAYADTAEADAKTYADGLAVNYDAAGSAATAEQNAKDYADNKINDASNLSTEVWSAYKTGTEISVAQTAAQEYADDAVAALVGSAPELLDTIQELATALENNPDIIADLQDVAAGKQDTLTAGANIDITASTISVTGLDTDDVAEGTNLYFTDQRAIDAVGGTATSENTANTVVKRDANGDFAANDITVNELSIGSLGRIYEDEDGDLVIANIDDTDVEINTNDFRLNATDDIRLEANDYLGITSLSGIIEFSAAGGDVFINGDQPEDKVVVQGSLDNILNGETPFTDLNINDVAKQVAARSTSLGSVPVTAYQFNKSSFKSGKFLVKIDNGTHNEISEILLTLDSSNNVAITEYAIVGTNGPRGTITATVDATHCQIVVTPVDDSTITVAGTVFSASEIVA
jgi:hypothetical protein